MRNLTLILSSIALLATSCAMNTEEEGVLSVASEPVDSVSQKITACGFEEYQTATCRRIESLGTCTEYRSGHKNLVEAREICEANGGQFLPSSSCPRENSLYGACPVQETPGELRLHYYYAGPIFADDSIPNLACSALNDGAWCSGR